MLVEHTLCQPPLSEKCLKVLCDTMKASCAVGSLPTGASGHMMLSGTNTSGAGVRMGGGKDGEEIIWGG